MCDAEANAHDWALRKLGVSQGVTSLIGRVLVSDDGLDSPRPYDRVSAEIKEPAPVFDGQDRDTQPTSSVTRLKNCIQEPFHISEVR